MFIIIQLCLLLASNVIKTLGKITVGGKHAKKNGKNLPPIKPKKINVFLLKTLFQENVLQHEV